MEGLRNTILLAVLARDSIMQSALHAISLSRLSVARADQLEMVEVRIVQIFTKQ